MIQVYDSLGESTHPTDVGICALPVCEKAIPEHIKNTIRDLIRQLTDNFIFLTPLDIIWACSNLVKKISHHHILG